MQDDQTHTSHNNSHHWNYCVTTWLCICHKLNHHLSNIKWLKDILQVATTLTSKQRLRLETLAWNRLGSVDCSVKIFFHFLHFVRLISPGWSQAFWVLFHVLLPSFFVKCRQRATSTSVALLLDSSNYARTCVSTASIAFPFFLLRLLERLVSLCRFLSTWTTAWSGRRPRSPPPPRPWWRWVCRRWSRRRLFVALLCRGRKKVAKHADWSDDDRWIVWIFKMKRLWKNL